MSHCENCGQMIQGRTSPFESWDEEYRVIHTDAPPEGVDFSEGIRDVTQTRHFCCEECLIEGICGVEGDSQTGEEPILDVEDFYEAVEQGEVEETFTVEELDEVLSQVEDAGLVSEARDLDSRKTSEDIYIYRLEELDAYEEQPEESEE